jgi:ankyrin repeat protein
MSDEEVRQFFEQVAAGNLEEVHRKLSESPGLIKAVGPHPFWGGRPQALHVAIETKRRDMFDLLLEAGADVNGNNLEYDHWSPLMLAAHRDRQDMREELIRRGARVGLVEALMLGDDARLEELLNGWRPALPSPPPNGGSLLMFARTTYAIDRLIELGEPLDLPDRWGATPMQALSRLGARGQALVAHLAQRGVPVSAEDLARLGDLGGLADLASRDPLIVTRDTVLLGAVESGQANVVAWLLERGADVNARTGPPSRHTALHSAAFNGNLPLAQLLVHAGADLTLRDEEHHGTPEDWADAAITIRNDPTCREVAAYLAGLRPATPI